MSLFTDLGHKPENLSPGSRFTCACGLLYLASGILLLAWPQAVQIVLQDPAFSNHEESLLRVIGMTLTVIGWLYFFGGRTGGRQFVAASVVDRLILVPLVLIPIGLSGTFPHVMFSFAALDPLLGLIAWRLLAKG